jgi:hypothetical protein
MLEYTHYNGHVAREVNRKANGVAHMNCILLKYVASYFEWIRSLRKHVAR